VAGTIDERIERIAETLAAWPHLVNAVEDVIEHGGVCSVEPS
jgi:hypothetical protein